MNFLNKKSAAPAKAKGKAAPKKAAVVKPSGSKATRGWLGGQGGAQNLDKWYGEPLRTRRPFATGHWHVSLQFRTVYCIKQRSTTDTACKRMLPPGDHLPWRWPRLRRTCAPPNGREWSTQCLTSGL